MDKQENEQKNVKITQITSATGKEFVKIYGLGDDNKIYQWNDEKRYTDKEGGGAPKKYL